jgi:ribose transport system ATP-binding protein
MLSTPLLQINNASKSYNGIPALIDAALELLSGEVHALMGENGAGKSTLIKLMAGVTPADSIQVFVEGKPASIHHPQAAFDLGLRFIHQELNVIPQLSVAENIFLSQPYPTTVGVFVRWRALYDKARRVLEQLGVTHIDTAQMMARLSPGDQMLVSIARAFVGDDVASGAAGATSAIVYVMDEPTAALTGQETDLLFNVINRLRERGSAVLYVSHRLDEIFRIANRVTVMRDGRVVETRDIQNTNPSDLIRLMTGRALQQVYPPREQATVERVLLTARGLRTKAVRDVSFELREGEILGIAGLAGSGRTEVLRGLMGVDRLLGGSVTLDGKPIRQLSPTGAWQKGIAYVPEERRSQGLILSRSIGNNITLPHLGSVSMSGLLLDHAQERQTSARLGEAVRLKSSGTSQTVKQLSGGNQQKVVFARALTKPPRLMLLDEPTRGVDVGAKYDIYALIRHISGQGTGIIMVSSDLPELLGMTDRILVMRAGQMVELVPTAGLTEEQLLALCYGEIAHGRHNQS